MPNRIIDYLPLLREAIAEARSAGLEPPAMLVVGDVVRLRAGLDWLGAAAGKVLDPDPLRMKVKSE